MRSPRRYAAAAVVGLLALAGAACKKSVAPNVAATVNGRPITIDDLNKQYKRSFPNQPEGAPFDQVQFQKLELLRVMIDEEIMLQRAEKLGLIATDAEVEAKFNELRAPYTQEQFQSQLNAQQMTADELKSQLRRNLSLEKLMNKEIISQITITDKNVADFYEANKGGFNYPETQFHVAHIIVTPQPVSEVRNLKRDKVQNDEQARKKILMLEARLKQGEEFAALAQNYSEDPQTAMNGGDLGFIPESNLTNTDPETRKAILGLTPGQISSVIKTPVGYRIVRLLSRVPAGQRELSDPKVQQDIRELLRQRREQLLRNAYVDASRNEAEVSNYFSMTIAPGFNKK